MPDDISLFLNQNFYGIPIWFMIAIALMVVAFFFLLPKLGSGKKDEQFKPINIEKSLQENITHMANIFMKYIDKPLVSNLNTLAHIYSGMPIYWDSTKSLKDNLMDSLKLANNKDQPKEGKIFYLLKISKSGIFNKALGKFLNYGKSYVLIDNDLLIFYTKEIVLKSNISPSPPYFGITIFSDEGKEYVESIVWKIANEQFMGEVVNYIKKQTYIETHQAKTMEELDGMTKLRKEAKKDAIEELTGAKKK